MSDWKEPVNSDDTEDEYGDVEVPIEDDISNIPWTDADEEDIEIGWRNLTVEKWRRYFENPFH